MTLNAPESTHVPRIAAKARLHYDEKRERHVLLYPEGLVVLNPTGTDILRLCDGVRPVGEIVSELERRYSVEGIEADVRGFLHGLALKGLVTYED
jgi:pyrroloquinoline quinone biosynthesis protein D